ncbi:hypothetical protein G6F22_020139 [Rhizopus arrhizus]|nr:hypothetical protein G6F22_020139 [Rhizopus arrhizus]
MTSWARPRWWTWPACATSRSLLCRWTPTTRATASAPSSTAWPTPSSRPITARPGCMRPTRWTASGSTMPHGMSRPPPGCWRRAATIKASRCCWPTKCPPTPRTSASSVSSAPSSAGWT